MTDCCDDNDRTLDQAYTSSTSGARVTLLDCEGGEDTTSAFVAVDDGIDTTSSVAVTAAAAAAAAAAVVVVALAGGAVMPRATVSNRLSSSFPPDSLSRAFMTSCIRKMSLIRTKEITRGYIWGY